MIKCLIMNTDMSLKLKRLVWDGLIIYARAAWNRVLGIIKTNDFAKVAMLQGFDKTWGAREVLCRRRNLHIEWNWKGYSR